MTEKGRLVSLAQTGFLNKDGFGNTPYTVDHINSCDNKNSQAHVLDDLEKKPMKSILLVLTFIFLNSSLSATEFSLYNIIYEESLKHGYSSGDSGNRSFGFYMDLAEHKASVSIVYKDTSIRVCSKT